MSSFQSEHIGQAVYNHDWFHADLRYRKMLILIVKRAQQPSRLKATIFLKVSLVTVSDVSWIKISAQSLTLT